MKVHPLLWVLALVGFLAPVVYLLLPRGNSMPPDRRFPFLAPASLIRSSAPHYSRTLKYFRGNSYFYQSSETSRDVIRQIEASGKWRKIGTTRFGDPVYRHMDGARAYVSNVTSNDPSYMSRITIVDSVRRVGWAERQIASAWYQLTK